MKRKIFLFSWVCFMVHAMNKILLIDDDIQVRESVSLSLETAGYTVMVAGTSQEGLQNYENFRGGFGRWRRRAHPAGFSTIFEHPSDYTDREYSILWWKHEVPSPIVPADLHIAKTLYGR
jgi:CheY-like chemotaxis protein